MKTRAANAAFRAALRKAVRAAIARGILPATEVRTGPVVVAGKPYVLTRRADGIYILGER